VNLESIPLERRMEALAHAQTAQKRTASSPARRGRRYQRHVGEFSSHRKLSKVTVPVQGSRSAPYLVTLDLFERWPRAVCSCPYSDGVIACKHTWAALEVLSREIRESLTGHEPQPAAKQAAPARPSPRRPQPPGKAGQAWEAGLRSLDAFLGEDESTRATSSSEDSRVVWRVALGRKGHVSLTPYEQRQTKRSKGLTKGRRISLERLARQADAWGDPQARAVARLVEEQRQPRTYYYYEEIFYDLDAGAALKELVGSPHVYWEDRPEQRVEVRGGQVGLSLVPHPDGSLELVPTFAGELLEGYAPPESPSKYFLLTDPLANTILIGTPGTRALELVGNLAAPEARRFPKEHLDKLLARLDPLGRLIPLKIPAALQGELRPADPRLRLLLTPTPAGLSVQARVRPAGNGGEACLPGAGDPLVAAWSEGERARYQRDLDAEVELAAEVLTWLTDAPRRVLEPRGDWLWRASGEGSLDLVSAVQVLDPAVCVAEWPEGEALTVSREVGPSDLRVKVEERRDWFGIEGDLEVDGEKIPLSTLLELIPGERYLPLEGGRWLRVSDLLRKQISSLQDVSQGGLRSIEVDATAAPIVEGLLAEAGEVRACEGWGEVRARLERARKVAVHPPRQLRAELRPYQLQGFAWLKRLSTWGVGACLADDMGLGKTVQAIALLLTRTGTGPALVVAPTSVGGNWRVELQRFAPSLRPVLYREADRSTVLARLTGKDVVVISYDLARIDRERLGEVEWGTLVFDEAQQVKNGASKTARALQTLPGKWRLALTGTPVENHLGELWALFRLISPGLFGSWERFKRRFAGPIERDKSPERRAALAALIQPFVLRRTKDEVLPDLPQRSDILLEVELSARERAAYQAARLAAILKLSSESGKDARFQALAAITKLRQLACHPRLVDPAWEGGSAKLSAFEEVLWSLREGNHRALVFSQFTRHLALVRELLEREGVPFLYLDGRTSARKRQELVDAFQSGEGLVFLISLKAGGRGLNLTGADYVVHLDPWWNPAVEDQASDRAHRLGQTKPVTVYRMVAKGTLEEQILELHARKRDLVAGILSGADRAGKLSTDELLQLIRGG